MRVVATLAAWLLLSPLGVFAQAPSTAPGHFAGWPDTGWGADKQTFDARLGAAGTPATFSVAQNGFGWQRAFTGQEETFNAWDDVTAWCWGPGTVAFRTRRRAPLHVFELPPDALVTIVDGYFKRYAAATQWSAPQWTCTPAALTRPHPANISKVVELLEAATSER